MQPNEVFGKLTTIGPIKGGKFWLCRCACGNTTKASRWHLENHKRKSCGCRLQDQPQDYICRHCGLKKPREDFYLRKNGRLLHRVCKTCKLKDESIKGKKRHHQLRIAALKHYGGNPPTCECCGEKTIEFLHLDHKNNDGGEHRKKLKSLNIYRWLKQQNYPDIGLRVLCANCNLSIGAYGYCPHQNRIH
jgi:hypothetical protein